MTIKEDNDPKTVYQSYVDCGRMGSLDSVFVARPSEIAEVLEKAPTFYLHEVLGKHSEIRVTVGPDTFRRLTSEPAAVDLVETYGPFGNCNLYDSACDQIEEDEWDAQDSARRCAEDYNG